jgi:uncharacterized membrane protein
MLLLFAIWLGLVLLAPFTLPSGSVTDLSGRATSVDNADQIAGMNPLAAAVYWAGDVNCHQLPSRSYFLNGNQMPFCARDLGVFVGLVAGMALALLTSARPSPLLVALGFLPLALDGGWQLLTDYESSNALRLLTGILAGMSAAMLIHLLAMSRVARSPPARARKGASR